MLIPARCRFCPYLFEGECWYQDRDKGKSWALMSWTFAAEEDEEPVVSALRTAGNRLKVQLSGRKPTLIAVTILGCYSLIIAELNVAFGKLSEEFPSDIELQCNIEIEENLAGAVALLCAWREVVT